MAVLLASYEVVIEIAKGKKPRTFGDASAAKVQQTSLFTNINKRRVSSTFKDVTVQVIQDVNASSMFSFQVDETTDVSS